MADPLTDPLADPGITIREAVSPADLAHIRSLFFEYAESLNFDLCFQDFDAEMASLETMYAPPRGTLLIARVGGHPVAGGVGLRPLDDGYCEMKRMYVRPGYRGLKLGERLASAVIGKARDAGYRAMRLDTVADVMPHALALYRALGFREIAPYYHNPLSGAQYYELDLAGS